MIDSTNYTFTLTALSDGLLSIVLPDSTMTDLAGNPNFVSNTWSVVVDTTPPDTTISPTASGTTVASGATTNTGTQTFYFTSTESGSTFECSIDGGAYSLCTSSKTYTGLSDTTHTVLIRSIDTAGNTDPTPAAINFTVDTTAPTLPTITQVNSDTTSLYLTNSGVITIQGTAEINRLISIYSSTGILIATGTTTASGTYSLTLPGTYADGSYAGLTITATNTTSGNVSSTTSLVFTVDTTPPVVTLT